MSAANRDDAATVLRRGRPRSEARKQAILHAAFDLLGERGLGATSMDAVADRAGVSKATIYRWWDSKELLALDALYAEWDVAGSAARQTGTLRGEMLALVRPWVRLAAAGPSARILWAYSPRPRTVMARANTARAWSRRGRPPVGPPLSPALPRTRATQRPCRPPVGGHGARRHPPARQQARMTRLPTCRAEVARAASRQPRGTGRGRHAVVLGSMVLALAPTQASRPWLRQRHED